MKMYNNIIITDMAFNYFKDNETFPNDDDWAEWADDNNIDPDGESFAQNKKDMEKFLREQAEDIALQSPSLETDDIDNILRKEHDDWYDWANAAANDCGIMYDCK